MIELRHPTIDDGQAIWELVRATGVLDVNSVYAYVSICRHFADTGVVAVDGDAIVGFVTAYRKPAEPAVLFVWQVAVAEAGRGQGLATRMLAWLLTEPGCTYVHHIETTVTPSNDPSRRLFESIARALDTDCRVAPCFSADQLGQGHEPEELFRIGPFERSTL